MDELTRAAPSWIVGVIGAAVLLSQAVPRLLGPIGQQIDDWAQSRRQRAIARDDADIADRDRVIAYQDRVISEQRDELTERDRQAVEHMVWDRMAIERCGPDLGPPPPLWPSKTTTPKEDA